LGLFAVVLSFYPSHRTAEAAGPGVTVLNTPLPVTGSVNATVTGTVGAQQSGLWNVGINGVPSVNASISNASVPVSGTVSVSSLPSVNLGGSVTVGNTSANPVLTRAVDNALQPFQITGTSLEFAFNPPVGKILVMEYLMVECIFTSAQTTAGTDFRLEAFAGGGYATYLFAPTLVDNIEIILSQPIHIYADNTGGGTEVRVFNGGSIPSGASCTTSISGHLVSPL
jgi:hypothetical protein